MINIQGIVRLTDTQCRTAKPKEKLYRLDDFNGLYVEVKPNGKKAWRLGAPATEKPRLDWYI
ncbi:Arm DNA-binding domain-containing protein [Rahnella rivi]|uniref:Arm DNA-binding domain-containing protein n=1 Tax=Rahnella rivi TaxID=2816249 RepID=UPI003B75BB5F